MIEFYKSTCKLNLAYNSKIKIRGWQALSRTLKRVIIKRSSSDDNFTFYLNFNKVQGKGTFEHSDWFDFLGAAILKAGKLILTYM